MQSRWLVTVVMCVGYFLVLLDVTIVNVALPQIGLGTGAGVAGLQWVVDGYAVALASLLLAGGAVGDVHGHRRVVFTGLVVFGTGSLGCALAPGVGVLVSARVVQGVGAALLLPGSLAIIAGTFPDRHDQARAIGIWAAVGSAALPAGPLLGGLLVQTVGWRGVFFINVPIVVVAVVVAARVVREDREQPDRRIDWRGVSLGGLFLVAVTFAAIQAGHAGFDPTVVVTVVASVVLLLAFVAAERSARDPMLPLALLRRPGFTGLPA